MDIFLSKLQFIENRSCHGFFRSRMELWIKIAMETEASLVLREMDDSKSGGKS